MQSKSTGQFLGTFAALFLALFLFYPLLSICFRSFKSWQTLSYVLSNPFYIQRIAFSFYQAILSTILTVAVALPSAIFFAKYDFVGKRLIKTIFTIPFVMPTVVAAIGFLTLIGPKGITNINLKGSFLIILLAHVFYNYALVLRLSLIHI